MKESFGYAKAIKGDNSNVRVIMVNKKQPVAGAEQYDVGQALFKMMKASTGVYIPLSTEGRNLNKKQYQAVLNYIA